MRRALRGGALALALVGALGCEGRHLGFPFDFERMIAQPRYDPYAESRYFDDGMAMRAPPAGTVPFRAPAGSEPEAAQPASGPALTRQRLEHGRDRFEIFCAPCHGVDGRADTPVAASMTTRAPVSLHEPRVRRLSLAQITAVIRSGYGLMPRYADVLSPEQVRDVAEYVRVLQASQHQVLAELPEALQREARERLAAAAPEAGP